MIDRRTLIACTAAAVGFSAISAKAKETLAPNGLHVQPWLAADALDMRANLAAAHDQGKMLMVVFEQRGCPYCRKMHTDNFARPTIVDFLTGHFLAVQVDLWGRRPARDFDGSEMTEAELAREWLVQATPTTLFFDASDVNTASFFDAEVFRMPGILDPLPYFLALRYASSGETAGIDFQSYARREFAAMKARGDDLSIWLPKR